MSSHSKTFKHATMAHRPVFRSDNRPNNRPKNLRLISIRLPLPALISILHRASGMLLFLVLPVLLWLLSLSLQSPQGFEQALDIMTTPWVKLFELGLIWAFLHHFFAGLRHLSLDLHFGLELAQARFTSKLVLAVSLLLTVAAGVALW